MTDYTNLSEPTLIHLLKLSDQRAYQELYKREVRPLMIYAYRFVEDWQEVEIAVGEVLSKLWHGRNEFGDEVSLSKQLESLVNPILLTVVMRNCDRRASFLSKLDELMREDEMGLLKQGHDER